MPYRDEQVEKIVLMLPIVCENAVRSAFRAYGELMARKRCPFCAEGSALERFGANRIFIHRDPLENMMSCKASDIWESLEEK